MTPLIPLMATCTDESKIILERELLSLGAREIVSGPGIIYFQVTEENFYRAHLKLRTCDQIFHFLRHFSAKTGIMFFDQARRVNWQRIIDPSKTYHIQIHRKAGGDDLAPDIIVKKLKEAVNESFFKAKIKPPLATPDRSKGDVSLMVYFHAGKATLSVVTSGKSMHKRGYRTEGHPAPLKENLAASILQLAGHDGTTPLLDPMCGSGTIAIEAALISLSKAPLIHRKKGEFAFEQLSFFNRELWRKVQDETRNERTTVPTAPIWANDINSSFVDMAQKASLKARVERHIKFSAVDFLKLKKEQFSSQGLIVSNLPYGERIGEASREQLAEFYSSIGDALKKNFAGWKAALLVAKESPWKSIGLHPTKKISLKNGGIPCQLMIFELFDGSRKGHLKISQN